jgi:rhomboid protease GluP
MCPHCRAFITNSDRICPYCQAEVGTRAVDRRSPGEILGGLIPQANFTITMILLINVGLYAATALYSVRAGLGGGWLDVDGVTLFQFGAKYRPAILAGQWWRLITAGFLHGGLLHIAMNSWVLYDLGAQVEQVYGTRRLLVFYFAATLCGFGASAWWSPALSVGASAGLFGLIGAMIALGVRYRTSMGLAIRGLYVRWAIYGLAFGLLPGLRVDNAAHLGGLAAGFGCAYLAGLPSIRGTLGERIWRLLAIGSVAATLYCFLMMVLWLLTAEH